MIKYPKPQPKKKRRHHAESIMQPKDGQCWMCSRVYQCYRKYQNIQKHHVFLGHGLREISEANGFTVYLCPWHHTDGPNAVHRNKDANRLVQAATQARYEVTHTREEFMALIGRNYIQ